VHKIKIKSLLVILVLVLHPFSPALLAETKRDIIMAPEVSDPYGVTWLVVIGINSYQRVEKLDYALSDAEAFRLMMIKAHGVSEENILTLYNENATRDQVAFALGDALADPARVQPEDRVIIFFAGHGTQAPTVRGGEIMGYLLPVDADPANLASTAISMREINESARRIPARSILFLIDACYGGIAGQEARSGELERNPYKLLEMAGHEPAIQLITAGDANQPAFEAEKYGHSLFSFYLLKALAGEADLSRDGIMSAADIFDYVAPHVIQTSGGRQTPKMFSLYGNGQVLFFPPGPGMTPAPLVDATKARLIIKTTPPGANVTINKERMGKTPSDLNIEPGNYEILVKNKGYRDERREISLRPGQVDEINIRLAAAERDYKKWAYIGIGILAAGALAYFLAAPDESVSSSSSSEPSGYGSINIIGSEP